ncbi:hypothetical protein BGX23_011227 [Mortierella sp. AD031]|nr:hypothetical protein BGX23_011227 [Mortierella sp. AD031]
MEVAQPIPGQHTAPDDTSALNTSAHSTLHPQPHGTFMAPAQQDSNATTATVAPTASATPTLSKQTTVLSEPNLDTRDSMGLSQESNSSMGGSGLSDESGHSADDSRKDTAGRSLRQQSKERAIEHVLQQGKILKVRRGWSKYTLQEVESLIQPGMSPRITSKRPLAVSTSPRYSNRKRVRKEYPEYEQPSDLVSSNRHQHHQDIFDESDHQTSPTDLNATATASGGQGRRYRSRPSFSQFKDSELFLPAKSLMDIATSSPSQSPRLNSFGGFSIFPNQYGFQSPCPLYRDSTPVSNWSSFSQPTSPVVTSSSTMSMVQDGETKDDESEAPSETQAARTILLLASSPTRPPPRTLDHTYLSRERAQAAASATAVRSPTVSPVLRHAELATSLSSLPGLTSGMTSYSPMTSSPLVQFQTTAASTPSPDRSPTLAYDNPFLVKRGVAGASGTRGGSNSPLASDSCKQGSTGSLGPSVSKHEPTSPSPLSSSSLPVLHSSPSSLSGPLEHQETSVRAMTPVKEESDLREREFSLASPPPSISAIPPRTPSPRRRSQTEAALGVRTPPPSGNKEGMNLQHYSTAGSTGGGGSIAESIAARRRNSGLTGGSGFDMVFPTHTPPTAAIGPEENGAEK